MLSDLDRKLGLRRRFLEPFVPHIDPNIVSASGFVTGPLAGYCLGTGNVLLGLVFVLLNAVSDAIDGTIARKYGRVTKTGSLVDDLADRVSDVSIALGLGGLAGSPLLGAFCAVLLVLNSYLSLQGLALYGEKAKFGVFSRANRTAAIILFLMASLATGSNLAALQLYLTIGAAFLTILQRTFFLFGKGAGK